MSTVVPKSIVEEFIKVALMAKPLLPKHVDGKQAIMEMKNEGSRNWRQMEWIGFWFEFFIESIICIKFSMNKMLTVKGCFIFCC